MLKQTKEDEKDLSKGSEAQPVSILVTPDVAQNIGGGRDVLGTRTDTIVNNPGSEGTPADPGSSGKVVKTADNLMSNEAWKKYLANETEEQKQARYAREQAGGLREGYRPPTPATPGTPPSEKKEDPEFKIDQEQVKGMGNLDLRREIRSEKALNRLDRQAERRQHRFERKGLKGQDKINARAKQKEKKRESNIQRQQDIQNIISQRKAQRDLQRDQGSFGGQNYYIGEVRANQAGMSAMSGMGDEKFSSTTLNGMPKRGSIKKGYFKK
jgi:hypothetical protein